MATQAYIAKQESAIVIASRAARHAMEAINLETASNGGFITPANRDHWNILMVNAQDTRRRLDELIALLDRVL